MRSAERPQRPGAEFFAEPAQATQRRYEVLRAYFVEGAAAAQVAARFGVARGTVTSLVRDFRAGDAQFFTERHPRPRHAPRQERRS
jgi:transposase